MKNLLLSLSLVAISFSLCFAQAPLKQAKKDFEYTIKQEEGSNASAVAWHEGRKMYFMLIAGNADFPLEGFDASGKNTFAGNVGVDSRGLWYNAATQSLELNAAGEEGWYSVKFSADLNTHEVKNIAEGQNQPDFQSVGAYDAAKKQVVFFNYDNKCLTFYSRANPKKKSDLVLSLDDLNIEDINSTAVGVTGKKGYEFVLLDYSNRKLFFFNRKGKLTSTVSLPEAAVTDGAFCFSFANNRVFLYDRDNRVWTAYIVF